MQVTYTRTALRSLRRMPARDAAAIRAKLTEYAETGAGNVIALQGQAGYRLRHGQWRALFTIEGDVIVFRIAHRREAYR